MQNNLPLRARSTIWLEAPAVELDLDRPPHERLTAMPDEVVQRGQMLLSALRAEIPPAARKYAYLLRLRTWNRFHKEAVAIANRVGADWREVMLANLSYELVLAQVGCSTVVLPTPDGPVVARNMDFWPERPLAVASCLIRNRKQGKLAFANAGWPGAVGVVTGLSGRGFAVILNAVLSSEPMCWWGYPMLLQVRRALEDCRDFEHAVKRLTRQRLIAAGLLTVVGTRNDQRVVIERSPRRAALRWGEEGKPLITTNDYRLLSGSQEDESFELYRTTCSRYEALCEFFADHDPASTPTDEHLLYVLSDPRVKQTITAQHILIRPRSQTIRLFAPAELVGTAWD
jgi:hypothetical protein